MEITGLTQYDLLSKQYIEHQHVPGVMAELPPTRFLYILCGWAWKQAQFGGAPPADLKQKGAVDRDPMLISLRHVSAAATILMMFASGLAALRMGGRTAGLGVFALAAFSPLLIHMSQHALIDGFFALWATLALWSLWENLRQPTRRRWLVIYGLSLAAMVMTKENSFFVYVALLALIGLNRWCRFGEVRQPLLIVTVAAPAVAVLLLVLLAGGPGNFIQIYQLLVTKAETLQYAIETGDGPWHRYLVDLLILSPIIFCLALGGVYCVAGKERPALYLLLFMAISYAIMCNIRYGMNLRYATIWDLPIRFLAVAQIGWLFQRWPARRLVLSIAAIAALCAYDLRQYQIFFIDTNLYELATQELLRAEQILK
jgi:4-amino-4-deoxy-L-arabinose transferase-like glycosyltransferase